MNFKKIIIFLFFLLLLLSPAWCTMDVKDTDADNVQGTNVITNGTHKADTGQTWDSREGTWGITTSGPAGSIYRSADGGNNRDFAGFDVGFSNNVTATGKLSNVGDNIRMAMHFVDLNNFIVFDQNNSIATLSIYDRIGGGYNLIVQTQYTAGINDVITWSIQGGGQNHAIAVNGTIFASWVDANFITATEYGLSGGGNLGITWSLYQIDDPLAFTPTATQTATQTATATVTATVTVTATQTKTATVTATATATATPTPTPVLATNIIDSVRRREIIEKTLGVWR